MNEASPLFYFNIYFVMWDPTSNMIGMIRVALAQEFRVCMHLMMD